MSPADYDPAKNSERSYALAIKAKRELAIRRGQIAPSTPQERRWASEGPRDVSQLEAVDLRSEHQKRISEAMKMWWRRRKATEAVRG